MLNHDTTFKKLVMQESAVVDIDPIIVEFAVADAIRYTIELEQIQSRRGKVDKHSWATEQAQDVWSCGKAEGRKGLDGIRTMYMIVPGPWHAKESIALQLLYHYWGIPYKLET